MPYIIIEGARGDAQARREPARDGLRYVGTWNSRELERCSQVVESDDPELLDRWKAEWSDVAVFEDA